MDPVSIGIAAAALLAGKFGENFAGEAGKAAWQSVKRLRDLVARKFKGDDITETAIQRLTANPADSGPQAAVAERITEAARADAGFAAELEGLVATARRHPGTNALIAQAFDSAKQVNIGGDNFGPLSL